MDLFKFTGTNPTTLEKGEFINKCEKKMWVERYREPGEFQIVGKLSSGLKDFLPVGTFISHADTLEVMIVENHEISQDIDEDPILTITGRTLDSFLENRFVGVALARASSTVRDYVLSANYTWHQVVTMINDHIQESITEDDNDSMGEIHASTSVPGTGTSSARTINRTNLLQAVLELLAVDDLGIKTIRRNTFPDYDTYNYTTLHVYKGIDKSNQVIFSVSGGHIGSGKLPIQSLTTKQKLQAIRNATTYLLSNKALKNTAFVVGRWVFTVVDLGADKYDRRMMLVDASDLDDKLNAVPTGSALTDLINKMTIRGQQALRKQNEIVISQADISNENPFQYRKDYNLGDLVTYEENFGSRQIMRVVEYAEIEDENGVSAHPTLSIPGA